MYYVWYKCFIYFCSAAKLNEIDRGKLWIGLKHSDNLWKWEFENTDEVKCIV